MRGFKSKKNDNPETRGWYGQGAKILDKAEYYAEEAIVYALLGAIGIGVPSAIGYGLFAEDTLDGLGDKGQKVTPNEAAAKARDRYASEFNDLNASEKYISQYLVRRSFEEPRFVGDWFLRSLGRTGGYSVTINDACLKGSPYDITARKNPRGTSTSGENALPHVDPKRPDEVRISPASSTANAASFIDFNSTNLTFKGVIKEKDGGLKPANSQTAGVLASYSCNAGLMTVDDAPGSNRVPTTVIQPR